MATHPENINLAQLQQLTSHRNKNITVLSEPKSKNNTNLFEDTIPKIQLYQSLSFDDVLLRPRASDIATRQEVALGIELSSDPKNRSLRLCQPLIASPMDTVCEERMAIHMALNGGLGIIHRFMDPDEQVRQVQTVKRYVNYIFRDPYTVAPKNLVLDIRERSDETGVWTYCVVADGVFKGLITRRDLDKGIMNGLIPLKAQDIMTDATDCYCISLDHNPLTDDLDITSSKFRGLMEYARELMKSRRVQKVPVIQIHPGGQKELLGLITNRSVMYYFQNMSKSSLDSHGRLRVGAAVGIKPGYLEQTQRLVAGGVDLICVDVANGHNSHTLDAVRAIRARFPELIIMSGNVCTAEGALALAVAGSDCIRIGIGNGSICSTRLETGVGFGQWSSVRECFDAIQSSVEFKQVKLICDGGSLGKSGNKFKALAAGAAAVMLGRTLASCDESPGQVITRNGKRMKYFRGMASTMANISNQERTTTRVDSVNPCQERTTTRVDSVNPCQERTTTRVDSVNPCQERATKRSRPNTNFTAEGVDGVVELKGSVADLLGQINGALRSGMSYLGVRTMEELHQLASSGQIQWAQQTAIGMSETGIRVSTF
jgi:IMP dehydrogenase